MSLIDSSVLPVIEKSLPKVISAKTHGMIDYSHAAFFLGMAFVCRKSNPRAAWVALGTGVCGLGITLLTDYPLGVKPLLSFETHGKIDAGFASASWTLPRFFRFHGTPAARVFQLNSVVEAVVVGLTDFNSERARQERE